MIDERAVVDESAKIAANVKVGPWTYIGPDVEIGEGTEIGPHTVIKGPTTIGKNNKIYQFSSIGEDPQDLKYEGGPTRLEIGDNNIFREFTTINRGTELGGNVTKIGNNNLFMAYVHIAHDCIVGNHVVFSNNASLAGHITVHDHVVIGGFSAVRQFLTLGKHSFVAGGTMVVKDVLPYILVSGHPAEPYGLNSIGLKRRGFSDETIASLKRAYKIIYRQGLTVGDAQQKLEEMINACPEVKLMIQGLNESTQGILR